MMTDDISAKAFEKSGGLPALVKWIKESARNRAAFYSWYIPNRLRQPLVQNNVNVAIADRDGEGARRKLFDAIMRDKESQHLEHGAVFVNGDRLLSDARMTAGGAVIIDGVSYARTDAQPLREAFSDTPQPATADISNQRMEHRREAEAADRQREAADPAPQPTVAAPVNIATGEPSTTAKYLEWSNNSSSQWWPNLPGRVK